MREENLIFETIWIRNMLCCCVKHTKQIPYFRDDSFCVVLFFHMISVSFLSFFFFLTLYLSAKSKYWRSLNLELFTFYVWFFCRGFLSVFFFKYLVNEYIFIELVFLNIEGYSEGFIYWQEIWLGILEVRFEGTWYEEIVLIKDKGLWGY